MLTLSLHISIEGHKMKEEKQSDFKKSFFITYILTCVTVIATVYIQYSIGIDEDLSFYRVSCSNYWVLSLAKVVDALVPTTITFALTLFIANYRQSKQDMLETTTIILLVVLVIAGITFTTINNIASLWIFICLIVILITAILICCNNLIGEKNPRRFKKTEKSDGKLF